MQGPLDFVFVQEDERLDPDFAPIVAQQSPHPSSCVIQQQARQSGRPMRSEVESAWADSLRLHCFSPRYQIGRRCWLRGSAVALFLSEWRKMPRDTFEGTNLRTLRYE